MTSEFNLARFLSGQRAFFLANLPTRRGPAGRRAVRGYQPRSRTVTRAELIAELAASNPHLRQEDAELIVAAIFDQITAALARGGRVELRGFGAFT